MFVYLGLESDLYMKEQRNAVCLWIGVIMTLHALCGHYCQQITHVPTISQGCLSPGVSLSPLTDASQVTWSELQAQLVGPKPRKLLHLVRNVYVVIIRYDGC